MKKTQPKCYRYLIEPRDQHTNDVLAAKLGESGEYLCTDGKIRFMYEAPNHAFVAYLQRSKKDLNADFRVFIQEDNKLPGPWPFNAAEKRKKSRKAA